MNTERISIDQCPLCQGAHTYRVEVERSMLVKMLQMDDMYERPRSVRFTRIFVCPAKNDQFQATFVLKDDSSSRIKSITISGVDDGRAED